MVFNRKTNGRDTKGSEKAQKHMAYIRHHTQVAYKSKTIDNLVSVIIKH